MIKAVVFDIGQTLIEYNKPLNWSKSYRPALERAAKACNIYLSETDFQKAINVLLTYNTRINPREYEVSSNKIFTEIFEKLSISQSFLNCSNPNSMPFLVVKLPYLKIYHQF